MERYASAFLTEGAMRLPVEVTYTEHIGKVCRNGGSRDLKSSDCGDHFDPIGASTGSTHCTHCSKLSAGLLRRPSTDSTPENRATPHLVGVGVNRIGKGDLSDILLPLQNPKVLACYKAEVV